MQATRAWHGGCSTSEHNGEEATAKRRRPVEGKPMYNIFYIIGVVAVVLAILGYFGFR